MTDPTRDPVRLTEAQWKVLTRLASDTPTMYIAPITRRWLLRAGYIRKVDVKRHNGAMQRQWAITAEGRDALANCIKAWIRPS